MNIQEFIDTVNTWGRERVPFLFIVDFELQKPLIWKLDNMNNDEIRFNINGFTNHQEEHRSDSVSIPMSSSPISLHEYKIKFETVYRHLAVGDSYLTNLTVKTPIQLANNLREIYDACTALYKLYYKDEFLVFSPERFVRIYDDKIYSSPMKGTIDASVPDASEIIRNNKKEMAEHVTIVDLIRNDLSMVAANIHVKRFRYVDEIKTNKKKLLQVSSEIVGDLRKNWNEKLGDILTALLPAGSVSGAPKKRTLSMILEAEQEPRGYYTGVFGYFDGQQVDSGVMIRYIEKDGNRFYYRSGGGITAQSKVEQEYQEIIDKVYVPIT